MHILTTSICLFALITTATGLICYVCATGISGTACNDPFNSNHPLIQAVNFPSGYSCAKIVLNNGTTGRGALPDCEDYSDSTGRVWCCSRDYCNGSEGFSKVLSITSILFIIGVAKMLNA